MRATHFSWLAVALLACGDDGTHHLDDGGTDGGNFDGTPGEAVTVTVRFGGQPVPGVKVYFLNADSSVVFNTQTGASGAASAVMAAGGTVTVIEPEAVDDGGGAFHGGNLDTYTGVKPGDELVVDLGTGGIPATFNLTIPTDANPAVDSYDLFTNCGGADLNPTPKVLAAPVEVTLFGCDATADFFVQAKGIDTSGSGSAVDIDDYVFAPGVAVADGVDITLDEATHSYQSVAPVAFTSSNLDGVANAVVNEVQLFTAKGNLEVSFQTDGSVGPTSGSATTTVSMPAPDASLVGLLGTIVLNDAEVGDRLQLYLTWGALPDAPVSLDVSTVQLKHFTTDLPTFDPATQKVAWTIDDTSAGTAGNLIEVSVAGDRTDPTAGDISWRWNIIAGDPSAGELTLPTLPTDVFDFAITAGDNPSVESVLVAQFPGGYDSVRALMFSNFSPTDLSATGTASTESVATSVAPALAPLRRAPTRRHQFFREQPRTKTKLHVTHTSTRK